MIATSNSAALSNGLTANITLKVENNSLLVFDDSISYHLHNKQLCVFINSSVITTIIYHARMHAHKNTIAQHLSSFIHLQLHKL